LTDALAVEQVEGRGLVEVYPDGRRLGTDAPMDVKQLTAAFRVGM
jgi:hypothetical protein